MPSVFAFIGEHSASKLGFHPTARSKIDERREVYTLE
jgi:hypothetical protein